MLQTLNSDNLHILTQNSKMDSEYNHAVNANYAYWDKQARHIEPVELRAGGDNLHDIGEDTLMDEGSCNAEDDDNESQGYGGLYDWDLFLEPLELLDPQLSIKKRNIPTVDLVPSWSEDGQDPELLCNLISTELSAGKASASDKRRHNSKTVQTKKKLSRSQLTSMQRSEWDSTPIGSLGSSKQLANASSAASLPKAQANCFENMMNVGVIHTGSATPDAEITATRASMTQICNPFSPNNDTMNMDVVQHQLHKRTQFARQTSQPMRVNGAADKQSSDHIHSLPGSNTQPTTPRYSGRTLQKHKSTRSSISKLDEQETDDWIRQSLGPLAALRASSPSPRSSPYPQPHISKQQHSQLNTSIQQAYKNNSAISRLDITTHLNRAQTQLPLEDKPTTYNTHTSQLPAAPSPSSSVSAQIVQSGQKIDHKMRMFIDNMLSTAHPQPEALPAPPKKTTPLKKSQTTTPDTKVPKQSSREGRSLSVTDAKSAMTNLTTRSQHNASKWTIETLKHFFCRDFVEVTSSLTTPANTRQLEVREKELLRFMTEMSVNSVVGGATNRQPNADTTNDLEGAENELTRLTEVGPVREPEVTYVINTLLTFVASRAGVQVIPERKFERRSARDAKNLPGCIIDYAIVKDGVVLGLVECKSKREFRKDAFGHLVAELLVLQDRAGTPDVPIFGILTDGFRWVFAVVKGTELHLEHEYNNGSVIKVRRALRWKDLNQITEDMTALIGESTKVFDDIVRMGPLR